MLEHYPSSTTSVIRPKIAQKKVLARRQLALESDCNSSWLIELKQILRKYNLNEPTNEP